MATIRPGTYQMRIRSYDDRGVPGDWGPAAKLLVKLPSVIISQPQAGAVVAAKEKLQQEVELLWEPIPDAAKYRVTARSTSTEWVGEQDVTTNSVRFKLPVAQTFEWNVTPIDERGQLGEILPDNYKFELRGPALEQAQINKPISKFIRELSWDPPALAHDYTVELKYLNPQSKKWERLVKQDHQIEPKLEIDPLKPTGRYRLSVQAHSQRREDSPKVALDFNRRGGFRDPAALDRALLRDSISKPTNFYVIASYMVTQINYRALDAEANTAPSVTAFGGTGRLGAGYHEPESNLGAFAIADLSGFNIGGKNFHFASLELHGTQKLELGQKGELLFGAGFFSKQLPILKGTPQSGFAGVGKVRNTGPHAGLSYWLPLNDRYGVQLNARVYYSILGSSTNAQKVDPAFSTQAGVLGSYRINKSTMGFAGYAYRLDQTQYGAVNKLKDPSSYASPGSKNAIIIQGHYLNFVLDISF